MFLSPSVHDGANLWHMSRTLFLRAAILMLMGVLARDAAAQASHPIYLQYDGYVKNKDGTYTLAFGYFNLNRVDVSIQPRDDSTFMPSRRSKPADALFDRPGSLRLQHCGRSLLRRQLQWTVSFAFCGKDPHDDGRDA